jgi:glycine cleavage system aminomethyltransferase T
MMSASGPRQRPVLANREPIGEVTSGASSALGTTLALAYIAKNGELVDKRCLARHGFNIDIARIRVAVPV